MSNIAQNQQSISAYLYPIVPALYPRYASVEARKAARELDLMINEPIAHWQIFKTTD